MQSSDYAVLGAGLMGWASPPFIRHGHEVLLYDRIRSAGWRRRRWRAAFWPS